MEERPMLRRCLLALVLLAPFLLSTDARDDRPAKAPPTGDVRAHGEQCDAP